MFIQKSLVIIGETHGVASNPAIIDWVVRLVDAHSILLELEKKWTSYLKNITSKKSAHSFARALAKEQWITQSGLIGKEHVRFFSRWIKKGIALYGVKVERLEWNSAERLTAQEIRKKCAQYKTGTYGILVVGSLHARNKPFYFFSNKKRVQRYTPLGYLLKDVSVSIRIVYRGGTFFNFGIRKIRTRHPATLDVCGAAYRIRKSRSVYFDYDLLVGVASPIKTLRIRKDKEVSRLG